MSFTVRQPNDCSPAPKILRIKTDFHSHVLPGIDDGSRSIEESLEMLALSYESGVRRIVATPHFYARLQHPDGFAEKRGESYAALKEAIEQSGEKKYPQILLGAEVAYFDGISRCEEIKKFCVEGTPLILVEMPFVRWNNKIIEDIYEINGNLGLIPVIAHIDRYYNFQSKKMIDALLRDEILVQANAESFTDRRSKKRMFKLLSEEKIDFLGSDCHNTTSRKPNLDKASEEIFAKLGEDFLTKINSFCDYVFDKTEAASG